MDLKTPLSHILGIGSNLSYKLSLLNLNTVEDLIYHFPFRYDDFSNVSTAAEAAIGQKVTLTGEIWSIKNIYTRSRKIITQAIFNDGNSPIELTWFNQSYLTKSILTGDRLEISGKLSKYKNKISIVAPIWKKVTNIPNKLEDSSSPLTRGPVPQNDNSTNLIPIYAETSGLTSKWINNKVIQLFTLLDEIKDPLPPEIKDSMMDLPSALDKIHNPKNWQEAEKSRQRLGFDELFYVQLATLKARLQWQKKVSVEEFKTDSIKLEQFIKSLPFELTSAQTKVLDEILSDLKKGYPMNRLVQGEVGSGKTIVATIIAYLTFLNGFKTLFMAPTEILAFQHYETVKKLLEPLGINVGIYTGSKKFTHSVIARSKTTKQSIKQIATPRQGGARNDEADVIIGTHALLSEKLSLDNVGLVIIDEQQRFGVEQRTLLRSKAKIPHFLTMTATPIPRTVALTLYGDLDLSIIDEMPKGRMLVKTYLVPEKKRADSYKFLTKKIKEGDQVYVITPLIEQSESMLTVKAATVEYENLKKIFPQFNLGLLHGRLKSKEKQQVIEDFKLGKTNILVSTSVVEVGMDIPNATIMLIEGAEKFGLAQLHQLRGRVGRGAKESFCLLYTSSSSDERSRLKYLETTFDGLKLAELDLKIRGSGEIFGTSQSGRFEFKIASLSDLTLIEKTRNAASKLLTLDPTLDKHPLLASKLQGLTSNVMPD